MVLTVVVGTGLGVFQGAHLTSHLSSFIILILWFWQNSLILSSNCLNWTRTRSGSHSSMVQFVHEPNSAFVHSFSFSSSATLTDEKPHNESPNFFYFYTRIMLIRSLYYTFLLKLRAVLTLLMYLNIPNYRKSIVDYVNSRNNRNNSNSG